MRREASSLGRVDSETLFSASMQGESEAGAFFAARDTARAAAAATAAAAAEQ